MTRLTELEELSGPHLMLTYADRDVSIAVFGQFRQFANCVLLQDAVKLFVVVKRILGFSALQFATQSEISSGASTILFNSFST